MVLGKENREEVVRYQALMTKLLKEKETMEPTMYVARTAALSGKLRSYLAKQRDIDIDMRRMPLFSLSSTQGHQIDKARRMAMKGSVQPMRLSEFEPMVFALAKMEPKLAPRYGAQRSRVLALCHETKKELDKTLPREQARIPHAGAKRGRAAIIARRLGKKPKLLDQDSSNAFVEDHFNRWADQQFDPKRM